MACALGQKAAPRFFFGETFPHDTCLKLISVLSILAYHPPLPLTPLVHRIS